MNAVIAGKTRTNGKTDKKRGVSILQEGREASAGSPDEARKVSWEQASLDAIVWQAALSSVASDQDSRYRRGLCFQNPPF